MLRDPGAAWPCVSAHGPTTRTNPFLPAPPSIRGLPPTEQVSSALITAEMTTCATGVRPKSSVRRKCHVYTHPTARCPASCPAIIRSRSRPLSPGPVGHRQLAGSHARPHRQLARSHVGNHRQLAGPDGPAQPGCEVLGRVDQPKYTHQNTQNRNTKDVVPAPPGGGAGTTYKSVNLSARLLRQPAVLAPWALSRCLVVGLIS
jgi:hypothetical protein